MLLRKRKANEEDKHTGGRVEEGRGRKGGRYVGARQEGRKRVTAREEGNGAGTLFN